MVKKKILFIINPVSGGKRKDYLPSLIDQYLDHTLFDTLIYYTSYPGHASILTEEFLAKGYDFFVAVGGDGTINEIATQLAGTSGTLGFIPFGSGNGLTRALKLPIHPVRAIKRINQLNLKKIDTASCNGIRFFNMAGAGFDAYISHLFADEKDRGLRGYMRTTLAALRQYRPQLYHLFINGKRQDKKAYMISIANSNQFGNEAKIAPTASLQDGLLDICIIKPFPLYTFPQLALRMFSGKIAGSPYYEATKAAEATISRESAGPVHLDGEPHMMGKEIEIKVHPASLNIIG